MPGTLQPLDQKFAIVDSQGYPTLYFIQWAQQKQIDIGDSITLDQAQTLINDWAAARQIIAGRALDGGGFLSADVTIDHAESLVVPGTYGDATHVPQFVVDQEGHVQGVVLVPISGGGGGTNAGLAAHRYWALHFIGSHNFSQSLSEIEMHATPGGANQCSGGTPFASDVSGGAAANAFDGNINTFWAANTGAGGGQFYQNCWIGYDFGAGVTKIVQEVAITARNDPASNQTPAFGRLMYSDNGVLYTTAYEWNFATDFGVAEKRTVKSPFV